MPYHPTSEVERAFMYSSRPLRISFALPNTSSATVGVAPLRGGPTVSDVSRRPIEPFEKKGGKQPPKPPPPPSSQTTPPPPPGTNQSSER